MKLNFMIIIVAIVAVAIIVMSTYVALLYNAASIVSGKGGLATSLMIVGFASSIAIFLILYFTNLEYRIEMEKNRKPRTFITVNDIMNMVNNVRNRGGDINVRTDDSLSSEILMFSIKRVYRGGEGR